jgi:hypothetical protein
MASAAEPVPVIDPALLRRLTDAELERVVRLAGFEAAMRDCHTWRVLSQLADELHDRQRFPPTPEASPRVARPPRRPA